MKAMLERLLRTLLALPLALLACAGPTAANRPSPLVGQEVDVVALDPYDRLVRVTVDDDRVKVVDFWATWCEPCRDQLPFLDRLATKYADQGLAVSAVSFDEDRAVLETFLQQTPVSFPVLWDKGGGELAERLEISRLPTTLLIDRRGKVREVHLGHDRAEEERIEAAVKRLLAR